MYLLGIGHDAGYRNTIVNKQKGRVLDLVNLVVEADVRNAVIY